MLTTGFVPLMPLTTRAPPTNHSALSLQHARTRRAFSLLGKRVRPIGLLRFLLSPLPSAGKEPQAHRLSRRWQAGPIRCVAFILMCIAGASTNGPSSAADTVIDLWYGDHQHFGRLGAPPRWVNVLGAVHDPSGVESIEYRLNGAAWRSLSIGPDDRRLARAGDFNVEIATEELLTGRNIVELRATNAAHVSTLAQVQVELHSGSDWPLPYVVDWSRAADLQAVAQPIDGRWRLSGNGVRTRAPGYDRLISVGDGTWQDYEVDVSFVVHAVDPSGHRAPSNGPLVGVVLNWPGHTDWGGRQPSIGWWPFGGLAVYRWRRDALGPRRMLVGNRGLLLADDRSGWRLELGRVYRLRARSETRANGDTFYAMKLWASAESEPERWSLEATAPRQLAGARSGAVLLVAHHVDVTFGTLSVRPLAWDP